MPLSHELIVSEVIEKCYFLTLNQDDQVSMLCDDSVSPWAKSSAVSHLC